MQLKNDGLGLLARKESHAHLGIEQLSCEVDIGIDVIELNIDQGPLRLAPRELSGEKDQGQKNRRHPGRAQPHRAVRLAPSQRPRMTP